jgi:hypothetical protein
VATGVGSLPGTDIHEAVGIVLDELPDFPHIPELPARGPGADLIGRGAGLLVELPVELYAARWRATSRPGRDVRHARDLLERDLDAVTDLTEGYTGRFKLQACGPWTLAASVELAGGGPMLRDEGAVRDLVDSLTEGLRLHVDKAAARLPGAQLVLQLDEPSLPAVLAGQIPTESGFGTLRAVEPSVVRQALTAIIGSLPVPVAVHCCAPDVPIELIRESGAAAIGVDLALLKDLDALGEAVDAGVLLYAGAVATGPPPSGRAPAPAEIADRIREPWNRLGFSARELARQVVVTPACGLAGAAEWYVRPLLTACREAQRRLDDDAD